MHRDRHAFTLVELLVVVAIIAVLLAILLPALNQSRFEALKAQCGANMHQLITTIAISAQQNKQVLPLSPSYGSIDDLARTNALDNIIAGNAVVKKATVCPANSAGGISYFYNPHPALVRYEAKNWTNNATVRWSRLSQYGKGRALLIDRLRESTRISHTNPRNSDTFWNMAFSDGSVRITGSKTVYAQMKLAPATTWAAFNDYARVLELTVQQRDPRIGSGHTIPWGQNLLYPFCTPNEPAPE